MHLVQERLRHRIFGFPLATSNTRSRHLHAHIPDAAKKSHPIEFWKSPLRVYHDSTDVLSIGEVKESRFLSVLAPYVLIYPFNLVAAVYDRLPHAEDVFSHR